MTELIIRADGGPEIGAGHLMRCLALAAEWRRHGAPVLLVTNAPSALLAPYAELGVSIEPIDDQAPRHLGRVLQAREQSWVVLDGYHFTAEHHRAVRQAGHWLMLLDDMGHLPEYDADLILNQNVDASIISAAYPPGADCLLGTRYILLRQAFAGTPPKPRKVPDRVTRLLLTMGCADPLDLTSYFLRVLNRLDGEPLSIDVLVGGANRHASTLEQAASASRHDVLFHRNASNVRAYMEGADMALSAVGITCYELAYLGVPAIIVPYAQNQYHAAKYLDEHEMMISLGPAAHLKDEEVASTIATLVTDARRRAALAAACQNLVDGRGPQRVVQELRRRHGRL